MQYANQNNIKTKKWKNLRSSYRKKIEEIKIHVEELKF